MATWKQIKTKIDDLCEDYDGDETEINAIDLFDSFKTHEIFIMGASDEDGQSIEGAFEILC